MTLLASADELKSLLQLDSIDADSAELLLTLASGLVAEAAGVVGGTWTADSVPARAKTAVLAAAARAWSNPEGLKRAGDLGQVGGDQFDKDGGAGRAGVYLTPAEMADCQQAARGAVSGVASVRMRNVDPPHRRYCPSTFPSIDTRAVEAC